MFLHNSSNQMPRWTSHGSWKLSATASLSSRLLSPSSYFLILGRDHNATYGQGQSIQFIFNSSVITIKEMSLRIQLQLNTALRSTVRPCVRVSVTGVTYHISHIYKGINAMLIIRGPIKPYKFWIKIILAIFLENTRPNKIIFSALINLTIDLDFELSNI